MTSQNTADFVKLCITDFDSIRGIELLKAGADINYQNSRGRNLLMYAVERQNFKLAYFLVKNSIDRYATDIEGHTAYDYIQKRERTKITHANSLKDLTPLAMANLVDPDRWILEWCKKRKVPTEVKDGTLYIKGDLDFGNVGSQHKSIPICCLPKGKTIIEGDFFVPHVNNFPDSFFDFGGLTEVSGDCKVISAKDPYALSRSSLERVGKELYFYGNGGFFGFNGFSGETIVTDKLPVKQVKILNTYPAHQYCIKSPVKYICEDILNYRGSSFLNYIYEITGDLKLNEDFPFKDLGFVTAITGNLKVESSNLTSLGKLCYVGGDVILYMSNVSDLGDLESCNLLSLNEKIHELKNVKKLQYLDIKSEQFHSLGKLNSIGHLNLNKTAVKGFEVPISITNLIINTHPVSLKNVEFIEHLFTEEDILYQMYIPPKTKIENLYFSGKQVSLDIFHKIQKDWEDRDRESNIGVFDLHW